MAISFGGDFTVQRRREEVFDFLTDPKRFAPLLPDFQGLSVEDSRNFTVKVNVGISYIRGTAEMKMELAEAQRPCQALYKGSGPVPGGSVNITAGFELDDAQNSSTRVQWRGEAQVFGRLISLAGGLLEPLARKNVEKLIESLQKALQ